MTYRIAHETPSVEDYIRLRREGGLGSFTEEAAKIGLAGSWFAVCVKDGERTVGMGRIIGDGGCFFQIVDIAVEPACRGKGLGKQIMAALVGYFKENAPQSAYVSLIADLPADRLYAQFGFKPVAPRSIGMAMKTP